MQKKNFLYRQILYDITIFIFISIIININIVSNITYFVKLFIIFVNWKLNISRNYYVERIFRIYSCNKIKKKKKKYADHQKKGSKRFNDYLNTIFPFSSLSTSVIFLVRFFSFFKEKWLFQDFHWLRVSWQTITLAQEDK